MMLTMMLTSMPWAGEPVQPFKILPDRIETITDLKITVIKPAFWSWNPFRRAAMKKRGEEPKPRLGARRTLRIEGITKIK